MALIADFTLAFLNGMECGSIFMQPRTILKTFLFYSYNPYSSSCSIGDTLKDALERSLLLESISTSISSGGGVDKGGYPILAASALFILSAISFVQTSDLKQKKRIKDKSRIDDLGGKDDVQHDSSSMHISSSCNSTSSTNDDYDGSSSKGALDPFALCDTALEALQQGEMIMEFMSYSEDDPLKLVNASMSPQFDVIVGVSTSAYDLMLQSSSSTSSAPNPIPIPIPNPNPNSDSYASPNPNPNPNTIASLGVSNKSLIRSNSINKS